MRGLDEHDRTIIELSMWGSSPQVISAEVGVSERKVVRVRRRIKERLLRMQADEIQLA